MTSSAWARMDGGIVSPSAWAVLRLITSSNLVGCWTGRSAGLAPLLGKSAGGHSDWTHDAYRNSCRELNGYRPVNKYLPPRPGRMVPPLVDDRTEPADDVSPGERLLRWVDRLLTR